MSYRVTIVIDCPDSPNPRHAASTAMASLLASPIVSVRVRDQENHKRSVTIPVANAQPKE